MYWEQRIFERIDGVSNDLLVGVDDVESVTDNAAPVAASDYKNMFGYEHTTKYSVVNGHTVVVNFKKPIRLLEFSVLITGPVRSLIASITRAWTDTDGVTTSETDVASYTSTVNTNVRSITITNPTGAPIDVYFIQLRKVNIQQVEPEAGAVFQTLDYIDGLDMTYEDTNFVAGDSPKTWDVNTDLGRNGHKGFIIVDGTGDISVQISNDGLNFGGVHTMKKGEVFELDGYDISAIKLTHTGTDSAYRITVL